jgi:hypothetical protein
MTYQELAAEIVRLPISERLALAELVTRSVREELAPRPTTEGVATRLRGIAKTDVSPHWDTEEHTLGELLESEFFGMWKDREDITDSAAYARHLRETAWRRSK